MKYTKENHLSTNINAYLKYLKTLQVPNVKKPTQNIYEGVFDVEDSKEAITIDLDGEKYWVNAQEIERFRIRLFGLSLDIKNINFMSIEYIYGYVISDIKTKDFYQVKYRLKKN